MNCEQALSLISAQIDREISAEERQALEEHLHECPQCRVTLEAFLHQDHELRQTFEPRREAVRDTVSAVAAQLPSGQPADSWSNRYTAPILLVGSLAATIAFITALAWYPQSALPPARPDAGDVLVDSKERLEELSVQSAIPGLLTPRPRPVAARTPEPLKVGEELKTKAGQRRRVVLPDSSVLFVNQKTSLKVDGERSVSLDAGCVYLEVAPKTEKETFVVKTPSREVKALGTRFSVECERDGTAVLVTQGKVQVSGLNEPLLAGQCLKKAGDDPTPSPRCSHALAWTCDLVAAAESPLVPGSQYSGGALIAVDRSGQQAKLSLRKYHVDVHIEDGFARTTIDQTYFNHHPWRLEGTFYFPLPADASLSRLAMYVNGKLMEGGMAEREYARSVYQKIVNNMRDPALLEWVDGTTFKMRVFPLEGRQEKRIILSYTQRLPTLYGKTTYRFPAGHNLQVVNEWSFHALVKNAAGWQASSPTHPGMTIETDGGDLVLNHKDQGVKVDQDVVVELTNQRDLATGGERIRLGKTEHEKNTYLMLRYRPDLPGRLEPQRRDWLFLFESSSDRDPLLARTQIEIVRTLLAQVGHDDTFNIVTAGSLTRFWSEEPRPATPENARASIDWLERTHLIGTLDLGEALRVSVEALTSRRVYPGGLPAENPHLVHIGSGLTGMGAVQEQLLQKVPEKVRYVGIGVGKRWSRPLMKQAAEKTGGLFTQINPDESVGWRAFDLLATLNTPRLLDARVEASARQAEKAPLILVDNPTIAQGEELCAVTRWETEKPTQTPETLIVKGLLDGKPFRREVPVRDVSEGAGYLPRTWAKLEIDRMLAADPYQLKPAIVELSKAMYVMTPYTSLLVLENEAMYKEFNVDRGRKDHWAMYSCADKIPVVYEPDPSLGIDTRNAPANILPTCEQVIHTVHFRPPTELLYRQNSSGENQLGYYPPANALVVKATSSLNTSATTPMLAGHGLARQMYSVGNEQTRQNVIMRQLPLYPGQLLTYPDLRNAERNLQRINIFETNEADSYRDLLSTLKEADTGSLTFGVGVNSNGVLGRQAGHPPILSKIPYLRTLFPQQIVFDRALADASRKDADDKTDLLRKKDELQALVDQLGRDKDMLVKRASEVSGYYLKNAPIYFPPESGLPMELRRELASYSEGIQLPPDPSLGRQSTVGAASDYIGYAGREALAGDLRSYAFLDVNGIGDQRSLPFFGGGTGVPPSSGVSGWSEAGLYQRLLYTGNDRLFTDLVSYAPGLSSSAADTEATVEAEAAPNLRTTPGKIDPAARKLIERARQAGWRTITLGKPGMSTPPLRIVFDGSGRYRYEQALPTGLLETVICDGKTLWHLYPEIGLASRRSVSRFHRAELAGLFPWLPLPAEDLARGADLLLVAERTVAIVPHLLRDPDGNENRDNKKAVSLQWRMVFAEDGRLAERQIVLVPSGKVIVQQVYDQDGMEKVLDGKGKELWKHQSQLSPAEEPQLKPDLDDLVVAAMPLRTHAKVFESAELDPNRSLGDDENGCYRHVEPELATQLLVTLSAERSSDAALVLRHCEALQGKIKAGHFVLLAASGCNVTDEQQFHDLVARSGERRGVSPPVQVQSEPAGLRRAARLDLIRFLALVSSRDYRWAQSRWPINLSGGVGPEDTFLGRLAHFFDLTVRWTRNPWWPVAGPLRRQDAQQALAFIRKHRRSPLAPAMLCELTTRSNSLSPWQLELAKVWGEMSDNGKLYEAAYEQARALYRAGRKEESRKLFLALYERTLERGLLPVFDGDFYNALVEKGQVNDPWITLLLKTASRLIERKSRPAVVLLAQQARTMGDIGAFDNLLTVPLSGIKDELDRLETYLTAVSLLMHHSQDARAEKLVLELLDREQFREMPGLWRLAAQLAERQGQPATSMARLERALDLEYRFLPDVIQLQGWRNDYGRLLDHYLTLTPTLASTDKARSLVQRTIRAADRWRADDPEEGRSACEKAGTVLKQLGQEELAWEYLTSTATVPADLARQLNRTGDYALAERAFATACRHQPSKGELLWDRAMNLIQAGKKEEGRQLLRQLVQSQEDWPQLKQRARWCWKGSSQAAASPRRLRLSQSVFPAKPQAAGVV